MLTSLRHRRRLHVLLIANRTDSRDTEFLKILTDEGAAGIPAGRVIVKKSRLGEKLLTEVSITIHFPSLKLLTEVHPMP